MIDFINLISKEDFENELIQDLEKNYIEQKFLFLDSADMYYSFKEHDTIYSDSNFNIDDFVKYGIKSNFKKNQKIALISLGCGNASREKELLEKMEGGYNIDYFFVDSSDVMLKSAKKNLSSCKECKKVKKKFVCANFFSNKFLNLMDEISPNYDKKIFVIFSNLFGNFNPLVITSTLKKLLKKGDKLRFDVRLKDQRTKQGKEAMIQRYEKYLKSPETLNHFVASLKHLKVPIDRGQVNLFIEEDAMFNSLSFQFKFFFIQKTKVLRPPFPRKYILPGESFDLIKIIASCPKTLVAFLEKQGFKLDNQITKKFRGHFFLTKK